MARKTYAELSAQAQQIRVATISKSNSATRIGTMLQDLIDSLLNNGVLLTAWDMSTNLFPANSIRGQGYYGTISTTCTLVDAAGNPLPSKIIATSLIDNASTTDPTQWAFTYTIN